MDWRKFFGAESDDKDRKPRDKFNFKKFDDEDDDDEFFDLETFFNEFHDNKFRFHGFPNSILKQFKTIIDAMEETEVDDQYMKEKNLQKFHENYSQFKQKSDQDLDGKIYADQLDTLLKRINPELMKKDDKENVQQKPLILRKLTDEEKIMDIIHGTYKEPVVPVKPRKRHIHKAPISPHHFSALPPFHEFPPPSSSSQHHGHSRAWGKTIISIRNADGSSETRKVERTPDGNTRTTITKMDSEGKSSTKSFVGDENKANFSSHSTQFVTSSSHDERNLVTYDGYKIPCLW